MNASPKYSDQWVRCPMCTMTFNVQDMPGLTGKHCEARGCQVRYKHHEVGTNRVTAVYVDPLMAEALEPVSRPKLYTDFGTPNRKRNIPV